MTEYVCPCGKHNDPWVHLFDFLHERRKRLCHEEFTVGGKKIVRDNELIFYWNDVRCILTVKGWKFQKQ